MVRTARCARVRERALDVHHGLQAGYLQGLQRNGILRVWRSCKFLPRPRRLQARVAARPGVGGEGEAKKEAMARLEKMERELGENGEASHPEDEDDGEDETPHVCAICGSTWADERSVVTKCKHYFCEHCALKHNAKEKLCFVCKNTPAARSTPREEIVKRVKEMKATRRDVGENSAQDGALRGGVEVRRGVRQLRRARVAFGLTGAYSGTSRSLHSLICSRCLSRMRAIRLYS